MSAPPPLVLRVVHASPGGTLPVGTTLPVTGDTVVLGRSPDADLVLADPTVSRRHARLEVGAATRLTALTASNGTFLDGAAVPPHRPVAVPAAGARLQLGGVLLELVPLAETEPVLESLASPPRDLSPAGPVLAVTWDAGQCVVRCGGRDLGLTGHASQLLGELAGRPGEVVHHWDLEERLGTPHLAPLATAARNALRAALDDGRLSRDLLRARLHELTGEDGADLDDAALMRRVVRSRRGHGYTLCLRPEDVRVEQL